MKKINTRRLYYHIRHKYLTLNNVVVVVAFCIAAGWIWGSLGVMQRNYILQKDVDSKQRQLQLAELETSSAELEKRYYQTNEYQELAVRERLGLVNPGEHLLILPPNSEAAKNADKVATTETTLQPTAPVSNFQQWINFLFSGAKKS